MRKMGGLKKYMPLTEKTYLYACIAIAGFPIANGFFSKDEILWKAFDAGNNLLSPDIGKAIWLVGWLTALGTSFYMWRSYYMTFTGEYRGGEGHGHDAHGAHPAPVAHSAHSAQVDTAHAHDDHAAHGGGHGTAGHADHPDQKAEGRPPRTVDDRAQRLVDVPGVGHGLGLDRSSSPSQVHLGRGRDADEARRDGHRRERDLGAGRHVGVHLGPVEDRRQPVLEERLVQRVNPVAQRRPEAERDGEEAADCQRRQHPGHRAR